MNINYMFISVIYIPVDINTPYKFYPWFLHLYRKQEQMHKFLSSLQPLELQLSFSLCIKIFTCGLLIFMEVGWNTK